MDLSDIKTILVTRLRLVSSDGFDAAVERFGGQPLVEKRPQSFLKSLVIFPNQPAEYQRLTDFQIKRILQPRDQGQSLTRLRGRILILKPLSSGGQGSVYLAFRRSRTKEIVVAVKAVPDAGPNVRKRFEREANFLCDATARTEPGAEFVVRGLDSFNEGGVFHLVMEYQPGQTITDLVDALARAGKRLTLRQVLQIIDSVLHGLEFIHRRKFVHRDIKPANIIYRNEPARPHFACIVDLGIAKDFENSDTVSGTILGSPHYLAPECYGNAAEADERCDLYGLAATIFFMLTSVPPSFAMYWGSPLSAKAQLDIQTWADHSPAWTRKNVREIRPEVPRELSDLLYSSLDADLKSRPRSVAEFRKVIAPIAVECERIRNLQKNFGGFQRSIVHAIKSVVSEIDKKMYPFRKNAQQFTSEVMSIVERLRSATHLPLCIPGADGFNEKTKNLTDRFQGILGNIKSKVVAGATGKTEPALTKQFWHELLSLQQLLPELLSLEHELLRLTSGFC